MRPCSSRSFSGISKCFKTVVGQTPNENEFTSRSSRTERDRCLVASKAVRQSRQAVAGLLSGRVPFWSARNHDQYVGEKGSRPTAIRQTEYQYLWVIGAVNPHITQRSNQVEQSLSPLALISPQPITQSLGYSSSESSFDEGRVTKSRDCSSRNRSRGAIHRRRRTFNRICVAGCGTEATFTKAALSECPASARA